MSLVAISYLSPYSVCHHSVYVAIQCVSPYSVCRHSVYVAIQCGNRTDRSGGERLGARVRNIETQTEVGERERERKIEAQTGVERETWWEREKEQKMDMSGERDTVGERKI